MIFHHMTLLHVVVIGYAAFACIYVLRLWPRR